VLARAGNVIPWDLIEGQIKATHDYEASTYDPAHVTASFLSVLPAAAY